MKFVLLLVALAGIKRSWQLGFIIVIALNISFTNSLTCCDMNDAFSKSNCRCSATIINCTESEINNVTILQSLNYDKAKELETIIFTYNDVKSLPRNIIGNSSHKYEKLHTLDFSHNDIGEIDPGAFHRMPNLKTLILDYNNWDFIPLNNTPRIFNHSNLETLSLHNAFSNSGGGKYNAQVMTLLKHIFENSTMDSLQTLLMGNNALYGLPDDFFSPLSNLTHLDLSYNQLSRFTVSLHGLIHLEELNMTRNQFSTLPLSMLEDLDFLYYNGSLKALRLEGNPFTCDCYSRDFFNWMKTDVAAAILKDRDLLTCHQASYDRYVGLMMIGLTEDVYKCLMKVDTSYAALGVVMGLVGVVALVILYLNRSIFLNRIRTCKETLNSKPDSYYATTRYSIV